MIDVAYVADAMMWSLVWVGVGATGRRLLAEADRRRQARTLRHSGEARTR